MSKKAKFSFPAIAFKAAAVDGGYRSGVTANKTASRGAFHIVGDMVEIIGTPEMREDMVRIGMGTADIRYRGEFKKWSAVLNVRYNADAMSMEQIVNLFNIGGFACGIGEWRPAKDGSFGISRRVGFGRRGGGMARHVAARCGKVRQARQGAVW